MGRIARVVIPGCPHHVTQRGNHRQDVFSTDRERMRYLDLAEKYLKKYEVRLLGFSEMTNHVHHLAVPVRENSLALGFGMLHNDYARWRQIEHGVNGHLWQNRFFSCPTDDEHFWNALRYIELNPVRAGLVQKAWDWPWSSAKAHTTGVDETGLLDMDLWSKRFDGKSWREFLEIGISEAEIAKIRSFTRTGRPLGSNEFTSRLEMLTGRILFPQKPGRKKIQ